MLNLFKNGIVIQEKISYIDGYKGIEGFNWPLNFKDKNLKKYFDKNIQKSYFDLRYLLTIIQPFLFTFILFRLIVDLLRRNVHCFEQ